MDSELHDAAEDLLPKENEQQEAKLSTLSELTDLTDEVDCPSRKIRYLEENAYFGFPNDTDRERETILTALTDVESSLNGALVDALPVNVITLLMEDRIGNVEAKSSEQIFTQLLEQLQDGEISSRSYLGKIIALSETDKNAVPPKHLSSYLKFQKLLSPTLIVDESERAVIASKFSQLDMSINPDPTEFIQTEIFGDPAVTGISINTQENISKALDIPRVDSGTEIQSQLTQTNIDGSPRYSRENPLPIRRGIDAHVSETGDQLINASLKDGRARKFDVTGWSAEQVTELSEYLVFWRTTEEAGLSNYMEDIFYIDMSLIDQFDPAKARTSRQTIDALLGFNSGYDGKIITEEDGKFLTWMLQAFSPKGDAAQGDYSIESTNLSLVNLGIKSTEGDLNLEMLRSASGYLQGVYLSGQPSYQALQDHLTATHS